MNIAEFLLARIAEDEAVAQEARNDEVAFSSRPNCAKLGFAAGHLARRFDPARVLTECDAKRRIVALYLGSRSALARTTDPLKRLIGEAINESHADALKPLALPYVDHPDYREEWRP